MAQMRTRWTAQHPIALYHFSDELEVLCECFPVDGKYMDQLHLDERQMLNRVAAKILLSGAQRSLKLRRVA